MDRATIRATFEAALAEPPGEARTAFLDQACGVDTAARAEVERLLRCHSAVEQRVGAGAASLPRFGVYQAIGVAGRGGMGVVYEARRDDGEFERLVAIKVIGEGSFADFLRDDLRRERDILAGLDHPGIARLFDSGMSEKGVPYLVLEFIDGQHLDRYAAAHSPDTAARLGLFRQILDAVEHAHDSGVVHRDLKPSNILVTAEGRVKLLDFGTARQMRPGEITVATRSFTPEYASPELMSGQKVDARGDIYSLGVVYAKLLGPAARPHVVQRARALDPAARYASVAALRRAVFDNAWPRRAAVAAVAAVAVGAAAWFGVGRGGGPAVAMRISPPNQAWQNVSVSWDGKWLAFSSTRDTPGQSDIWVSRADGSRSERLNNDRAEDMDPAMSPDGRRVAFRSLRRPEGIYEFDRDTRLLRLIVPGGHSPSYSPDGKWLLYADLEVRSDPGAARRSVWHIVPALGEGEPRAVGGKLVHVRSAIWHPDSQSLLFQGSHGLTDTTGEVWRQKLTGGGGSGELQLMGDLLLPQRNVTADLCGAFENGDLLVHSEDGEQSFRRTDPRQRNERGVFRQPAPFVQVPAEARFVKCSVARDGQAFAQYLPILAGRYVAPFDSATRDGSLTPRRLPRDFPAVFFVSSSADGLTETFWTPGGGLYWLGPGQTAASLLEGTGITALLSGDGKAWWGAQPVSGKYELVREVMGRPDLRRTLNTYGMPWDVSRDGEFALFHLPPTSPRQIAMIEAGSSRITSILAHPKWNLYRADLSFDEEWVAFTRVDEHGSTRNMIAPFHGPRAVPPEEWIDVDRGGTPKFSPDGNRLYFRSQRDTYDCIWRIQLDPVTKKPLGEATPAIHFHGDESPHGLPPDSFMMSVATDGIHFSLGRRADEVWRIAP